jgi:hypothetical protein
LKPPLWRDPAWLEELSTVGRAFHFPSAHMGDLTGPVHPLFRSLERQPGFLPALRLASRHLYAPNLLPLLYALIFGPRKLLLAESKKFGLKVYSFSRPLTSLTETEIAQTQRALEEAAPHIHILFYRRFNPTAEDNAATGRVELPDHFHFNTIPPPHGTDSMIKLRLESARVLGPETRT